MKKLLLFLPLAFLILGCQTTDQQYSSLEIQAFQSQQFDCEKKVGFASVVSVFQDYGYIIASADLDTGLISANSPTDGGFVPFVGNVMKTQRASAFIETLGSKTKIRLNFVDASESSSGYGMKSQNDKPVMDPQFYTDIFAKVGDAIFIRQNSE